MSRFPRVWTASVRREYDKGKLDRADLHPDPVKQFQNWFEEGKGTVQEPTAVALATADRNCRPSVRMVLLKGYDSRGFVFATSYLSRKALELHENPQGALLFYWPSLERQIRIEGTMGRTESEESDAIFMDRPRLSRLAAVVSRQSAPIGSRSELEGAMADADKAYDGREVERPEFWGGFRLVPAEFEFWQGRRNRLHDRFQYLSQEGEWKIQRLQP